MKEAGICGTIHQSTLLHTIAQHLMNIDSVRPSHLTSSLSRAKGEGSRTRPYKTKRGQEILQYGISLPALSPGHTPPVVFAPTPLGLHSQLPADPLPEEVDLSKYDTQEMRELMQHENLTLPQAILFDMRESQDDPDTIAAMAAKLGPAGVYPYEARAEDDVEGIETNEETGTEEMDFANPSPAKNTSSIDDEFLSLSLH
ncbi:hypothetical protein GE09DRAFT_1057750 [Coniochaeta sp. 2T2.1]|nr:hypothetical protein GE09DRAFT_1057750 [Coniochaeta sp. 2T2.1]